MNIKEICLNITQMISAFDLETNFAKKLELHQTISFLISSSLELLKSSADILYFQMVVLNKWEISNQQFSQQTAALAEQITKIYLQIL